MSPPCCDAEGGGGGEGEEVSMIRRGDKDLRKRKKKRFLELGTFDVDVEETKIKGVRLLGF
jgi:hypothetical protein